jgi:hypothetical protein
VRKGWTVREKTAASGTAAEAAVATSDKRAARRMVIEIIK